MTNFVKEEVKDIKGIARRFKRRDFSGNTGKVIKNSTYQLMSTFVTKAGSILFTIILARFLMGAELFGLYGLAFSTILFLGIFNDFGISSALNFFLSKNIDKNPGKAKGYFYYLTKWKIAFMMLTILTIILISKGLASSYQKPIYLAILAGIIYLPAAIFSAHVIQIFTSTNNFKPILVKEIILQVSRLTIIPLGIIFFLSKVKSTDAYLFWIIILLSSCHLIAGAYLYFIIKKTQPFKKQNPIKLSKKERINLRKFILPLTVTALSGTFFVFIDQIMLGLYKITGEMLGFYYISVNLVSSISVIIAFSGAAIFPILTRIKDSRLERGFRKSKNITLIISILVFILSFLLAPLIIKILYGTEYVGAIIYFQILSLLIISFSMTSIYTAYYMSQKRTRIISILVVLSTVLNIVLNYVFIGFGLQFSMSYAVIGACIATLISQYLYMLTLIIFRRR